MIFPLQTSFLFQIPSHSIPKHKWRLSQNSSSDRAIMFIISRTVISHSPDSVSHLSCLLDRGVPHLHAHPDTSQGPKWESTPPPPPYPRLYRVSFPQVSGLVDFPVEGCGWRTSTYNNLRFTSCTSTSSKK